MKNVIILIAFTTILLSCSTSSTQNTPQNTEAGEVENTSTEWSIPVAEVLDGGPGRDGIPSLTNPRFVGAQSASLLSDDDLILGFKNGDDIRAYPHIILDWHEIINDNIGDVSLAVTYCPLTGTGIGWNRVINEKETTFGVSGLLYNTNLIPFDRATNSNWSQMLNESVNGSLVGQKVDLIMMVETNWKTWKTMYPNTTVVGVDTGFSRTYGVSPYGDYSTNDSRILFPILRDNRLPLKERVHAITDGEKSKVYRFSDFADTNIIKDVFNGRDYLIVGNLNFMVSFELDATQSATEFEFVFDGNSDFLLEDGTGNRWNIFGASILGNEMPLKPSASFMGYWLALPAFYEAEIYGN